MLWPTSVSWNIMEGNVLLLSREPIEYCFVFSETLACELYNAILNEKYNPSDSATAMDQYSTPWARSVPWIFYTATSSQWKQRTDLNLRYARFTLATRLKMSC